MSIIKPRRGTGSPAGSIETNEIAMDTAAKALYVSTDGTNAVILSDNTENFLANAASTDNFLISGTAELISFPYASGLGASVLNVKTSNSAWYTSQLSLQDSNDKTVSFIGVNQFNGYQSKQFLDPNNTHGRTGVSTFTGDYAISFAKNYSTASAISMDMQVLGANAGFILSVHDDNNSGAPNPGPFSPAYGGYGWKPFILKVENFEVKAKSSDTAVSSVLVVDYTKADFEVPIAQVQLASAPSSPANGWTYYNTTTDKLQLYAAGAWVDLN